MSAKDLAELGFCAVAYPWTLVAAKLKSIRETLEDLKKSMTVGAPPMILSYSDVCEGVGFNKYWVSFRRAMVRIHANIGDRILRSNTSLVKMVSPTEKVNKTREISQYIDVVETIEQRLQRNTFLPSIQ